MKQRKACSAYDCEKNVKNGLTGQKLLYIHDCTTVFEGYGGLDCIHACVHQLPMYTYIDGSRAVVM